MISAGILFKIYTMALSRPEQVVKLLEYYLLKNAN